MVDIEPLKELLRIPSISTLHQGIEECAEKVKEFLDEAEFSTQIIETRGHPVVFGEKKGVKDKTLLFYNHYDVQPPDPQEEWESPPFEPEVRNNRLYARGAADNKGDIMARIEAVRSFDDLPITVKFVIDGEEEIGSPNLEPFFREHTDLLKADACIWETWGKDEFGNPTLGLGVKGICYVELRARGPKTDFHSGSATAIENPAWVLVRALNTLKDEKEHILIDGFYDDVKPPEQEDIDLANTVPVNGELLKKIAGIDKFLLDMSDRETVLREFFEPTCNICGFLSGYTGEGSKTIIPSTAVTKLDFRLVPDQDPRKVYELLKEHLAKNGFSLDVNLLGTMQPARTSPQEPFVTVVREAMNTVYGREPVIDVSAGGSSPMWCALSLLGTPTVLVGVNDVYNFAHGPNESIDLTCYEEQIQVMREIIKRFG